MTNFLLLLLFGSFWIWGIYAPFSEGYIFEKAGKFLTKHLGKQIVKPLFACPVCMPSIHGSILAVVVYDFTFTALAFVICLCGLNYILKSILFPEYEPMYEPLDRETEDEIKEVLEFEEESIELAHRQRLINELYAKYLGK